MVFDDAPDAGITTDTLLTMFLPAIRVAACFGCWLSLDTMMHVRSAATTAMTNVKTPKAGGDAYEIGRAHV